MRIAFFTETFLPKVDGIVTTLCHLLDHLAQRGHQSLLFAPAGGPRRYANTPIIGLTGYSFPLYPELKLVPPFVDVLKFLTTFNPDLIHVVNPFSLGLSGLRHARQLGIPVVASYHTDIPGFVRCWGFEMLVEPFRTYLRWLHNQADLTLSPSRATQVELEAHDFQRIKVWARGVDTLQFHPGHRTEVWRRRLTAGQPDAPLLLFVGRLSPEKRVDWLRPVLEAHPSTRLAIVGDGPARSDLERCFEGTATVFTGYLAGRDLSGAYAAADIFVFPAANETFGNVVLEAMASRLPVVVAGAGGPLDFVVHGETGFLFDPNSQRSLIEAIGALLDDPFLARRLARNARIEAEARSWSHEMDLLLENYAALIPASRVRQAA